MDIPNNNIKCVNKAKILVRIMSTDNNLIDAINDEAPLFLGARMTNGVAVSTPKSRYTWAPARPADFPTKYTRVAI